jgi:hypothetical protein
MTPVVRATSIQMLNTPPSTPLQQTQTLQTQPQQLTRLLNDLRIPTSTEVAAQIQAYANSKDLATLFQTFNQLSTYRTKLLRLGRGATASITYDISLTPLYPRSLNDPSTSTQAPSSLLCQLTLYSPKTKTKRTTYTAIPLGRVLLNHEPTHWVIFLADSNLFVLRAESIAEEEEELRVVLHGSDGLGECTCGWRFDKYREVFGDDMNVLAVYLGDVGFLKGAQIGERRRLEWKGLEGVERWSSYLVVVVVVVVVEK